MIKHLTTCGKLKRSDVKYLITPKRDNVIKIVSVRLDEMPAHDIPCRRNIEDVFEFIKNYNNVYKFYSEDGLYYLATFNKGVVVGRYLFEVQNNNFVYLGYRMDAYAIKETDTVCQLGFFAEQAFIDETIKERKLFDEPISFFGSAQSISFYSSKTSFRFNKDLTESK